MIGDKNVEWQERQLGGRCEWRQPLAGVRVIFQAGRETSVCPRHTVSYEQYLQIPTFMRQGKRFYHR